MASEYWSLCAISRKDEFNKENYLRTLVEFLDKVAPIKHLQIYEEILKLHINYPKGYDSSDRKGYLNPKYGDKEVAIIAQRIVTKGRDFLLATQPPVEDLINNSFEDSIFENVIKESFKGFDEEPVMHLWSYLPLTLLAAEYDISYVYRFIKDEYLNIFYKEHLSERERFIRSIDWHRPVGFLFETTEIKDVRKALFEKLYSEDEVALLTRCWKRGLPLWYFMKPSYTMESMLAIEEALLSGKNYCALDRGSYNEKSIILICKGIVKDLHIEKFDDVSLSYSERLRLFREMEFVKTGGNTI